MSQSNEKLEPNWFSNMLPFDVPLKHDDLVYHTPENFYQAMKIDPKRKDCFQRRTEISRMNCYKSKTCFRTNIMLYYVRPDWTAALKLRTMEYALNYKFAPGTSWHQKLIDTGDEHITEFNDWGDTFWGFDVKQNKGQNHLGKLLMKIRARHINTQLENFMA